MRRASSSFMLVATCALAAALPLSAATATSTHPRWLTWSLRTRTVSLLLVAGYDGANNGFNFDGYGRGRMLVHVPLGVRVRVTCTNAGARAHSCAVVHGPQAVTPAFPGAASPKPTVGLRQGQTARFQFRASRAGVYRIACLVPGHEDARMWDVFVVGGVRRPSVEIRTGF
jgi:FtsP/CotA-like multicopper oxidase with cupredoxin domain